MSEERRAGRALDAIVAERVMGVKEAPFGVCPTCGYGGGYGFKEFPEYSTDIAAAWEVVEKLSRRNFSMHNDTGCSGCEPTEGVGWMALFHIEGGPMAYTVADTAPLAICLAALKAVDVSEPQQ